MKTCEELILSQDCLRRAGCLALPAFLTLAPAALPGALYISDSLYSSERWLEWVHDINRKVEPQLSNFPQPTSSQTPCTTYVPFTVLSTLQYNFFFYSHGSEVGTIIIFILHMRKLKPREGKSLTESLLASKWWIGIWSKALSSSIQALHAGLPLLTFFSIDTSKLEHYQKHLQNSNFIMELRVCSFDIFFLFLVLGIKPRFLAHTRQAFTTELHPQPPFW